MNIIYEFKEWLLKEQKLTNASSEVYMVSVRHFLKYFNDHHFGEFTKLEKEAVNMYGLSMELDKIPAATINSKMTGLKKFNQFLVNKGFQDNIVLERSHRVEPDAPVKEEEEKVSSFDVEKFLAAVRKGRNKRDLTLIILLMKTNLLISDIVDMKLKDYSNGVISVITQKNQKKIYHLDNEVRSILEGYIQERNYKHYSQSEYLFISNKSGKLDKRYIFHLFKVYSGKAMLVSPITPGKLSGFQSIQEEPVKTTLEYTVDKHIRMDINVIHEDALTNGIAKVEVIIDFKGNQKVFLFVAVKPDYFLHLLKGRKGFYPKGIFITQSFNKALIKDIILYSFYIDEKTPIDFLNQMDLHSLSENEFNNIEEKIVISL
ncbi:tyrosine-type recombinase/integrase [Neobacillus massiliamazoniensis]|uniref:TnpI resolvase n=1 Tax=Neobacillus massiliamazoniensis TaxID=1499688 RepID=A0A0U1P4K2_9BACI|nr:tyrosine-type recombinase/integrase [Neobacillus massiliamazoniensis]CRK85225.1 TnpI resolvase [Neobacillus massiliamazoniensis]